jgi:hypothetical protein
VRARLAPFLVAVTVIGAYAVWIVWTAAHQPIIELARVGTMFQGRAAGSPAIDALDPEVSGGVGYDGQFFLYIASDPLNADGYLDEPAYRYSRIVYPLLARAAAAGQQDAIPWALLLLNVIALGAGTFAVALLLKGRGLSPWYALLFGLYPGLYVAVSHDLAEPIAYAFAAAGLLAFERRHVGTAAFTFAVAGLTRETTLLFPATLALWLVVRRRTRDAAILAAAVVPYLGLRVGLWIWLGAGNDAQAQELSVIPFGGLLSHPLSDRLTTEQVLAVVAPSLAVLGLAIAARVGWRDVSALAANVLVLVVLLPAPSYADYTASGRIASGVVLAGVLCFPALARRNLLAQAWIVAALWLMPWYAQFPDAFATGS